MMPLATIAPGLDSAALTVLAGADVAMSATQIQRIGKRGSRYGLVLALERLVDQGVVTAIPASRGNLYQVNHDHVLFPVVQAAVEARAGVERRIAEAIDQLEPRPIGAALFGSVARGEATLESDIDLLIIGPDSLDPDDETWTRQVDEVERRAKRWTGNPLHVVTVTREQLVVMAVSHAAILSEWERDTQTIVGKDCRSLIRAARREAQVS